MDLNQENQDPIEKMLQEERDFMQMESSKSEPVATEEAIEPSTVAVEPKSIEGEQNDIDRMLAEEKAFMEQEGSSAIISSPQLQKQEQPAAFEYGTPVKAVDEDKDGILTIKALSEDQNFMDKVEAYYTNRVEQGAREEGETNEEYLNRFMSNHYRAFIYNDVYLTDQIRYLSNADKDTRLLFGDVFSTIEEKAPSVFSDEMGTLDKLSAVGDTLWYSATSLSNLATIAASGFAGTLAAPVAGTAAGAAAGLTAVRAASTSAIRSMLLSGVAKSKALTKSAVSVATSKASYLSKPMARAAATGAVVGTVEELMLQQAKRYGSIDPSTGKYDPSVSPEDLELDYLGAAQTGIISGGLQAVPEGLLAYSKLNKFKKDREQSLASIKQAQKDLGKATDTADAVTTSAVTGEHELATIQLAEAADKAFNNARPESLTAKIVQDFALIDNIPEDVQRKALDALQDSKVFENIGRVSIQFQKDLDRIGMLDVLGETAADTYRGLKPAKKGTRKTRITAAISDGLNGIERLFDDSVSRTLSEADKGAVLATLDEALAKSGVSKKDFMTYMSFYTQGAVSIGDITRKSMSTAAEAMYTASKLKREFFGDVYPNVDPEMRKVLDNYAGNRNAKVPTALSTFWSGWKTLDRVRVGSLTSQLVTTSRNILSGVTMVTGQTGVNMLDATWYQLGRGLQNTAQGNFSADGIAKGMADWWADSFSVISGVMGMTKSQRLIDATMEYTPTLHKQLIRHQPDMLARGDDKFARAANGYIEALNHFNIASDTFFRRAFYMSSLDKRYKKFVRDYETQKGRPYLDGKYKNVMQFVESGRVLDKKMISGATQDALKLTFSAEADSKIGKSFLRFMQETSPISSVVMPFPRFFANSLRTMYEYSALNPMVKTYQAMMQKESANLSGDALREAYSKAVIGTSSLAFMVNHLANKEDNTPWYDVGGVDIRAMWPLSAYGAMAEALLHYDQRTNMSVSKGIVDISEIKPRARTDADVKSYMEVISGIPLRGGEQASRVLDTFYQVFFGPKGDSVQEQKLDDRVAEFFSEYLGGYLTPLKMAKDVGDQVSMSAQYKDVRAGLENEDLKTKISARIANSYLPENIFGYDVQEPMPNRKFLLDNIEKIRQAPIARFVGLTFSQKNSELELELQRIGVKRKDLLPYTGSARLDDRQAKYFGHYAVEGFKDLLGSEEYNTDFNSDGVRMTATEKLNWQSSLVRERAKAYREYVKASASTEASVQADLDAKAMRVVIEKMKRENASSKDLADAYGQLAEYELNHLTNDEMKIKWDKMASSADASFIEKRFQRRHLDAMDKYTKEPEAMTAIDYLYLRGDNIVEQGLYGLAIAELEIERNRRKISSFGKTQVAN